MRWNPYIASGQDCTPGRPSDRGLKFAVLSTFLLEGRAGD